MYNQIIPTITCLQRTCQIRDFQQSFSWYFHVVSFMSKHRQKVSRHTILVVQYIQSDQTCAPTSKFFFHSWQITTFPSISNTYHMLSVTESNEYLFCHPWSTVGHTMLLHFMCVYVMVRMFTCWINLPQSEQSLVLSVVCEESLCLMENSNWQSSTDAMKWPGNPCL